MGHGVGRNGNAVLDVRRVGGRDMKNDYQQSIFLARRWGWSVLDCKTRLWQDFCRWACMIAMPLVCVRSRIVLRLVLSNWTNCHDINKVSIL